MTIFLIVLAVVALSFWLLPAVQDRLEARSETRYLTARGAALHGASVEVAEILLVEPPAEPLDEDDDPLPRQYYEIDVTIEPAPNAPRGWSPLDLDVFDPEEDVESLGDASADLVRLYTVDVAIDGEWVPEEELGDDFTIDGAGRLLLLVGAHESVLRCGLIYFTEEFGEIDLDGTTDGTELHESDS